MNRKKIVTFVLIIGVLLGIIFSLDFYFVKFRDLQLRMEYTDKNYYQLISRVSHLERTKEDKQMIAIDIPSTVLAKYEEMKKQFSGTVGASLSVCTSSSQKIYTVVGSGGYSGVIFYYHEDGREIGSSGFSDVPTEDSQSPVDLRDYGCTTIK